MEWGSKVLPKERTISKSGSPAWFLTLVLVVLGASFHFLGSNTSRYDTFKNRTPRGPVSPGGSPQRTPRLVKEEAYKDIREGRVTNVNLSIYFELFFFDSQNRMTNDERGGRRPPNSRCCEMRLKVKSQSKYLNLRLEFKLICLK